MAEVIGDTLTLTITQRRKWWFGIAMRVAVYAMKLGLIRSKRRAEYHRGYIMPTERVSRWLVDHAMEITVGNG